MRKQYTLKDTTYRKLREIYTMQPAGKPKTPVGPLSGATTNNFPMRPITNEPLGTTPMRKMHTTSLNVPNLPKGARISTIIPTNSSLMRAVTMFPQYNPTMPLNFEMPSRK